jgi:alcohol-forming fatty acyl-CoA reductase
VDFLLEKSYEPLDDPHEIIKIVENLSEKEVEKISKSILKDIPNTYTLTKALAEALVNEARKKQNLKAMVIRPSIVISTIEQPVPGWVCMKSKIKILLYIDASFVDG